MTKTQNYGTFRETPPPIVFKYTRNNGTISEMAKTAQAPYQRRIGRFSTLTSSNGRDGRFRPCTHVHDTYTAIPLTSLLPCEQYFFTNTGPTQFKLGQIYGHLEDAHRLRYASFLAAVADASTSLADVQWNALAATAVQGMMPSFNAGNSLVNFILELKDFKDVFKYVYGGFRRKVSRMDTFRIKRQNGVESNLSIDMNKGKPFSWLSKRYLEYNFGWLPLFRDVQSLVDSITKFELRYREMVRNELKPQQRYWGTTIPGTNTSLTNWLNIQDGPTGGWFGASSAKVRSRVTIDASLGIRYHAAMRYRYKLPSELFGVGGKLKAYLDALGVSRNPAILWNAIPFSFIVDWFVNVNGYLERLRLDNIQIQTEILDFCHSARSEKVVRFSLAGQNEYQGIGLKDLAEHTTDTCRRISYQRKTGIPDFRTAILTSGLNLREFALSGALMGVKRGY